MHILVEGMTEGKGGKESYIINTFRSFDRDKYHFSFVVYGNSIAYQEELEASGADLVYLPERKCGLFAYRKAIDELFRARKFDVVWANKTTLSSCEILELAKKNHIPLIMIHSHSSSNMGGKLTYILHTINRMRIKNWVDEYLACSNEAAKWFYGNKQCHLIKNGIDVGKFRFNPDIRNTIRKRLNIDNCFVIGHVGRFGVEKNHKKLIDVFNEVHKRNALCKLVLCGDGEERNLIEQQIRDLGLDDDVIIMGVVSNVNEVLQAMDVIVMPSLFEGLPFALLEAQASGLKCVVSDTVSMESNVIGWNEYLDLNSDNSYWAERILSLDYTYDRCNAADVIKAAGFDIIDCTTEIQQLIDSHFVVK